MNTFLDWAGEPEQSAIAEVCAQLFGEEVFQIADRGPGRVHVRGFGLDGARLSIPMRLLPVGNVRITSIGGTA